MAVTKILHMSADFDNAINSHLNHAITYILQDRKLGDEHLSAGINCLTNGTYEQMMETKRMFGKTGGRQGYQFILSLKPGEGTPQTMYQIAMAFAEKAFHNEYEAIVAVHTDKPHLHAHIIINSVNMITGKKFQYKNGDWKRIYQPITNELCEKYGLSIVPAEYSVEPSNISRKEYEENLSFRDFIREDCESLLSVADNTEHFIWLLRRLGYEVKEGLHIAVKVPGMKRYARLDTIDKRYARDNLEESISNAKGISASFPIRSVNTDHPWFKQPKTAYQRRFYCEIRGLRLSEKYRFGYKAAKYYKDILKLQKWQEEYNFICDNNIESFGVLLNYWDKANEVLDRIDNMRHKIYKENAAIKRKFKTPEDVRVYQEAYIRNGKRLDELREIAKQARKGSTIASRLMHRSINDYLERMGMQHETESMEIDATAVDIPEYNKSEHVYQATDRGTAPKDAFKEDYSDFGIVAYDVYTPKTDKQDNLEKTIIHQTRSATERSKQEQLITSPTTVTKQIYLQMTVKEKINWIGIKADDFTGSIDRFNLRSR